MQGLYMVSGVLVHFNKWPFQTFYQASEVDSMLQPIFLRKVNFFARLPQARNFPNFLQVFGNFSLLHGC